MPDPGRHFIPTAERALVLDNLPAMIEVPLATTQALAGSNHLAAPRHSM
jgi:hypothetical protein